jgi:hypothetical protein
MGAYEEINNLPEYGIQAGSDFIIEFPCFNERGQPIDLNAATAFGCKFSDYRNGSVQIADVEGTIHTSVSNTMVIEIPAELTEDLGDTVLYYRPYIKIDGKTWKWQGRIVVGETTAEPMN